MESSKWGADAKIAVDYEHQHVFITDLDHGSTHLWLLLAGLISGYGITNTDFKFPAVLIDCALICLFIVPNIPVVQRVLLRFETKHPRNTVVISNPSGVIRYETTGSTPLIDFEYDDGVRVALKKATLEPLKKHGHVLSIEFLYPSVGEMIIKEY